jgi:hypothetical protein
MVISRQLPPESLLTDPFEVIALKNKLEIAELELRQTKQLMAIVGDKDRERIDSLEIRLSQLIEKSFSKDISPVINNHLTVNANDHLSQNYTDQHGQGDNIGNDKVGQDKIGHDKVQRE